MLGFPRGNKKDLYPGLVAWIKVLLADSCPGSGPCDRSDETESAFSVADNYSPLTLVVSTIQGIDVKRIRVDV